MRDKLKNFDYLGFLAMLGLIGIGTAVIWSAGNARSVGFHEVWLTNLWTAVFALILYLLLAFTDYRKYLPLISPPAYALSLLALVLVLIFGSKVLGGRRWLWFFQPSEIGKLCVLMLLSAVFGGAGERWRGFKGFLIAVVLAGVPAALILAEPDLGTTLALVPAVAMVLFATGVWRRGLLVLFAVSATAAVVILAAVNEAERPGVPPERRERILKYLPLKAHQVKRVRTFLYPEADPNGSGWNLKQSKIAIGSGGMVGKGLGKGEQNHLKYLPPAVSMNDFIFCVYAEETGFRGVVVMLSLFALLLISGCRAAYLASDVRGTALALGVTTLLCAHVYINIGMSIGLMPITGLPLPFISAGRTFLVTMISGLGLVQSVSVHRFD